MWFFPQTSIFTFGQLTPKFPILSVKAEEKPGGSLHPRKTTELGFCRVINLHLSLSQTPWKTNRTTLGLVCIWSKKDGLASVWSLGNFAKNNKHARSLYKLLIPSGTTHQGLPYYLPISKQKAAKWAISLQPCFLEVLFKVWQCLMLFDNLGVGSMSLLSACQGFVLFCFFFLCPHFVPLISDLTIRKTFSLSLHLMLVCFYCQFDTTKNYLRSEWVSIGEFPRSNWLVGRTVGDYLDWHWCGRAQLSTGGIFVIVNPKLVTLHHCWPRGTPR